MPSDSSTSAQPDRSSSSQVSRPVSRASQSPRPGTQTISFRESALGSLATEILAEMHAAWDAGLPVAAEQWISQHPELAESPETAVLVIYEEFCLREEAGEKVDPAEFLARFPQWETALQVVLDCHQLFQDEATVFPEAGSDLGELRLISELGRGGAGRVFMAAQPSLSDRLLAVKLSARTGEEHLSLARLQHTHIVPLYTVLEFPENNLRALCMPFLGGESWSAVLHALADRPPAERSGALVAQLIERSRHDPNQAVTRGPVIGFLARAPYEQAVSWIGSCLADALHYAHQRGLAHLDIKPSNVLLAGDGQPMLLDFHLAHEIGADRPQHVDRIGGTQGYMSPEQDLCADAMRAGRPLPVAIDARSDIYSLGVLLYESLAGKLPERDEQQSRQALRSANPSVSRGLEDLIFKCLAPDRTARYATAGELADDLRRHLADMPLRGVANRSLMERYQKWRRRRPHALAVVASLVVTLAVVALVGMLIFRERLRTAKLAAAEAQQDIAGHDYSAALARANAGLDALGGIPGQAELKRTLQSLRTDARRVLIAQELHGFVEQLRFMGNPADWPKAKLEEHDAGCRRIWKARGQIISLEKASTDPVEAARVRADLLDLALLWTNLIQQIAPDETTGRRRALEVLDEAQEIAGPSPVLARTRAELDGSLTAEGTASATSAAPQTAWEHNAVGRGLMQQGQLDQAEAQFDEAVRLEPDAFWPSFNLTLCAYRRGEFEKALQMAFVSIALAPRSAECYFNRALCYEALKQPRLALADLDRAGQLGSPPGRVAFEKAKAYAALDDWPAARDALAEALRHDPTYAPALRLKAQLDRER